MKNKIKYAFGALLSMMLLLSACSQADEPQQVSGPQAKKEVKMREVEIEFTLDEEQVEELRAVYQKLDENGRPRTFITDADHVNLRFNWLLSKHSYAGDEFMGTLFDEEIVYATAKRVGRNQALYTGTTPGIAFTAKVPMPVVEYNRYADLTLVISVAVNSENTQDGLLKADKDGIIPLHGYFYSSGVIQLPIDIDIRNPKIVLPRLQLKPEGNLLRFDLENNTSAPAQVAAINLTSNAFSFYNPAFPRSNNMQGDITRTYGATYWAGSTLRLPDGPITVAPGEVKSYYLHVRPYAKPIHPNTTYNTLARALGPNSELYESFYNHTTATSSEYLKQGSTQSIKLRLSAQKALTPAEAFPGGHMPLAYMAEDDMTDARTIGSTRALFSYQDLGPNPDAGVTINQPGAADIGYYLPSFAQMRAAFMPIYYLYLPSYENNDITTGEEVSPLAAYGLKSNYNYIIDRYGGNKRQGICMLRFIGNGNRQLTAYRYTLSGGALTIEARYLGPTFTGTYNDIANDEFWSKPHPYQVVRTLSPNHYSSDGETARFLLANQAALTMERPPYFAESHLNELSMFRSLSSDRGQVRLFMRNPPQK